MINYFELTLHFQMLWTIFEYMSNEDRRNVRLVCKRFFEICIHQKFLRAEQFMCNDGIYSTTEVLTTLQKSEREVLQLKFYNVCFKINTDRLFEAISSKIQTLNFVSCSFAESVIEKILIMCSNLKQLTIASICYPRLLALLDYLERRNVIKTNIIFLKIDLDRNSQSHFSEYRCFNFTDRIIGILPNLQYLKMNTVFLKTEKFSILDGIKELGLNNRNLFTSEDSYIIRNRILSMTKYVQIY